LDTNGLDPRSCQLNSRTTGITKVSPMSNPLQCKVLYGTGNGVGQFGYFYIPDPQTGTFLFDNYQQPDRVSRVPSARMREGSPESTAAPGLISHPSRTRMAPALRA
jgi:hypothetical protein